MLTQIISVLIFLVMFFLVITEKIPRHRATLLCALATIVFVFFFGLHSFEAFWETINIHHILMPEFWYHVGMGGESTSGVNWETIVFIAGMMIMVEGMAVSGFFSWLCMTIAKAVKYNVTKIFVMFMLLSFLLSMFIDSITVILFLAAITVELSVLLHFNPVAFILAEIFCANLGGSATMCGDPPNIIIGTALGYTFADFFFNTGVIAMLSLALIILYFYLCFRRELRTYKITKSQIQAMPSPRESIPNLRSFGISCCIFAFAVILLITHAQTGLTVSTIGVIVAVLTCITAGKNVRHIFKNVDYQTLLFFIGLFVVVGGLEQTGILELIAHFIQRVSGGNLVLIIAIIIWVSAIASAIIDNIPFSATMIPIIKSLAITSGMDLSTLAWTLALGTDIGGSATPIGASANVVGVSVAAKHDYYISWKEYCKVSIPAAILVIAISMCYLFVRYL